MSAKRSARQRGAHMRAVRNYAAACPCCRFMRKWLKRFGNSAKRTPAKYRRTPSSPEPDRA